MGRLSIICALRHPIGVHVLGGGVGAWHRLRLSGR